jgi:hypothetical protein
LSGLSAGPSDDIKILVDPGRPATTEAAPGASS